MVYIVILNYKNYLDTIECLESVFKLDFAYFKVVVCDNASNNGSIHFLRKWAEGSLQLRKKDIGSDNKILNCVFPLVGKNIRYSSVTQSVLESTNYSYVFNDHLIFIENKENKGFAAGNNIGINFALNQLECDYIWLLNNDTVVDRNSLKELVVKAETDNKICISGSTLLRYNSPDIVQEYAGGMYDFKFGTVNGCGAGEYYKTDISEDLILSRINYVCGASMLIRKEFIQDIGLLNEEYFLYMEEQDLAEKARRKGYKISFAINSIVYHKEGSTIGCSNFKKKINFRFRKISFFFV